MKTERDFDWIETPGNDKSYHCLGCEHTWLGSELKYSFHWLNDSDGFHSKKYYHYVCPICASAIFRENLKPEREKKNKPFMKTKEIKVVCYVGFETYTNDGKTLANEVKENEILTAMLFEPTQEYFAKDSQGRGVFVGEIDTRGILKLEYGLDIAKTERACPVCGGTKIVKDCEGYFWPCPKCHN